jgi:dihydrofolate reductase
VRRVVVSEFLTLDGVAEDPSRFPTDWDDDVMDAHMYEALGAQDAVVLGRRTFDEWAPYWPDATIEPFASFINAVPKHVATSTPLDVDWAGTSVIEGGLVEFVRDLADGPGGDIGVYGSISVAQALLAAGLVDELRLAVIPAIAASGRRLLDGVPAQRLETVHSSTSPTDKLLLDYRLVR